MRPCPPRLPPPPPPTPAGSSLRAAWQQSALFIYSFASRMTAVRMERIASFFVDRATMSQSLENLPREGGKRRVPSHQRETEYGVDPGNQQGSRGLPTYSNSDSKSQLQYMVNAQRHVPSARSSSPISLSGLLRLCSARETPLLLLIILENLGW